MAGADATGFLRRAVSLRPNGLAVANGDVEVTYAELWGRSLELARLLPVPGHGPEPILVVTDHDVRTPEIYFGILASGNAIVPASARLPDSALHELAAAAGARLAIATPGTADRLTKLSEGPDTTQWIGYPEMSFARRLPELRGELPVGTAMVAFTSGTTGVPKGVIVTHTNLVVNGLTSAFTFGIGPVNSQVNPLPLSHFAGASRVVLATVHAGAHVILPEFEASAVLRAIEQYRGTHATLAPAMALPLLTAEPEQFDLASLETLVYGTAPMPLKTVSELMSRMDCGLINGYGLTESTGLVTALDAAGHRQAAAAGDEELLGSVGWAVPGVELRVVDDEVRDVPLGASGEVLVRGLKVTPGYLRNEAKTAERFLPDGWLRTGDRGRLAEGRHLMLEGRMDELIITGGVNVQPEEVEMHALRFPGVEACAAFSVPSDRWGEEVRLAVVLAQGGAEPETEALRDYLRTRLDRYKVPKVIHTVEQLPLTSLGKVRRSDLAKRFSARPEQEE